MRQLILSTYLLLLCGLCLPLMAVALGGPAPSIGSIKSLNTADGGPLDIATFRGKVVLVDFWATWCGPCRASIPHVEKIYQEFKNEGLVVIGHTDGTSTDIEGMLKEKGMHYPISIGSDIGDAYGVTGIPHVVLIGTKGNILWMGHPDRLNDAMIKKALESVSAYAKNGLLPRFPTASAAAKVAKVEESMVTGRVGAGMRDLKKMIERDQDAAAAQGTLDQVEKWIGMVNEEIASSEKQGNLYYTYQLCDFMSKALRGDDAADLYKDRLKEIRKLDAYKAGREFEKFGTVAAKLRESPAYKAALQKFIDKYASGYYVDQAKAML